MAVTYQEALAEAQSHVAEAPLDDPDYRLGLSQGREIPEGWYFDYSIEPIRPIPESEEGEFAGAPGFIIPSTGTEPRVVSWAEFSERKLGEAPLAS